MEITGRSGEIFRLLIPLIQQRATPVVARENLLKLKLFAALCLAFGSLSAAPITGLFNTGESTTGSADNYWTIVSPPGAGQVVSPVSVPAPWLPNTADSSWEWSTTTAQPVGSPSSPLVYTFRHQFLLDSSFNSSTVLISGRWSTDNTGTGIRVNGNNFAQTSPGFTAWSGFSLNSGFVSGLNVVEFVVEDTGAFGGFRVEWLTAEADLNAVPAPEPGT